MKALVTGGGGFVGKKLVQRLLQNGAEVVCLGRQAQPELKNWGAHVIQGDIRHLPDVIKASKGCEVVFHTAALAGVWGPAELYESINITGTDNVIEACRQNACPRLVFTSSPSVIFDGQSHLMADESKDYPRQWLSDYPRTKAIAEQHVLAAHQLNGLACCSLRPHLIFGAGDPHLVPRLFDRASKGRLRQVGNGQNWVDMVHVQNVVDAHLLADQALQEGKSGGQAYFITNGEPVQLWVWIRDLLSEFGLTLPKRSVSENLAVLVGAGLEGLYKIGRIESEPPMTRFVARQLATSHTYSIEKARRELGYTPRVSMLEGTREVVEGGADWPVKLCWIHESRK